MQIRELDMYLCTNVLLVTSVSNDLDQKSCCVIILALFLDITSELLGLNCHAF